ncbi:hypothetical protein EKO27_g2113 [Xylaria grammica]|uniref:Major facilitator superfamily (MFS) profile domain-containing protein n=1 Tax=Xylaria grammica TaxID=363999 RepID=A0A439DEZ8_9PEZI|nr:hypothetical protein EKO27_g2113 [Xylaria grammica]
MVKFPKITNTYFVALIATVGGMLFGFDISSIAAIIITPQYIEYFNNPSGLIQGAIGSALAAGSVVGSLMAGPISDKIGRRDSIMFACLWWLVGTAVQVSTNGVGSLIAGRVLNGVCVGITSSQVPVYLAEIAKRAKPRSEPLGAYNSSLLFFSSSACPSSPRSPRWLAKVGREEEAIQTLADIQAGGNKDDALVVAEWQEIYTVLVAERESVHGWRKFVSNGMWKRTLAGMSVQAWQQLSGANVIVYYLTYVFLIAGLQGDINLIASGIQYALFIIFTSVMFFFIDRTGRRTLLVWGGIGMGICHFVIGGVLGGFSESVPGGVDGNANVTFKVSGSASHTVIAFSYLLIIVYALTLAPVAWIYAAEVWSLGTRATGMSLAAVANWLFNFALGLFTPPAFQNIKYKVFIIFGVLCFGSAIQTYFTYPETCGKTIEEISELFAKGAPPAWKTKKGHSRLEAEVQAVLDRKRAGEAVHAELPKESGKLGSLKDTKEEV